MPRVNDIHKVCFDGTRHDPKVIEHVPALIALGETCLEILYISDSQHLKNLPDFSGLPPVFKTILEKEQATIDALIKGLIEIHGEPPQQYWTDYIASFFRAPPTEAEIKAAIDAGNVIVYDQPAQSWMSYIGSFLPSTSDISQIAKAKQDEKQRRHYFICIAAVSWAIYNRAALQGDDFARGSYKLLEPDMLGMDKGTIHDFLNEYVKFVGKTHNPSFLFAPTLAYDRNPDSGLSSHYTKEVAIERGIDFRAYAGADADPFFPNKATHLLCGKISLSTDVSSDSNGEWEMVVQCGLMKFEPVGMGTAKDIIVHGMHYAESGKTNLADRREKDIPQAVNEKFLEFCKAAGVQKPAKTMPELMEQLHAGVRQKDKIESDDVLRLRKEVYQTLDAEEMLEHLKYRKGNEVIIDLRQGRNSIIPLRKKKEKKERAEVRQIMLDAPRAVSEALIPVAGNAMRGMDAPYVERFALRGIRDGGMNVSSMSLQMSASIADQFFREMQIQSAQRGGMRAFLESSALSERGLARQLIGGFLQDLGNRALNAPLQRRKALMPPSLKIEEVVDDDAAKPKKPTRNLFVRFFVSIWSAIRFVVQLFTTAIWTALCFVGNGFRFVSKPKPKGGDRGSAFDSRQSEASDVRIELERGPQPIIRSGPPAWFNAPPSDVTAINRSGPPAWFTVPSAAPAASERNSALRVH